MHDLAYFRNNLDAVALRLADRGFTVDVEQFRKLDTDGDGFLTKEEAEGADKQANAQAPQPKTEAVKQIQPAPGSP